MRIKTEQNFVDTIGGHEILDLLVKHNTRENQGKLLRSTSDAELLRINKEMRKDKEGNWTKSRTHRQILNLPPELAMQIEQRIPGFFKDKRIMVSAIKKDPFLQQFLTVPVDTI